MRNQEPGKNLFCLFGDCSGLAMFGDYCKDHQLQRAESAEARAAQLEAERDELRKKLKQARSVLKLFSDCAEPWERSDGNRVLVACRYGLSSEGLPDLKIYVRDLFAAHDALEATE